MDQADEELGGETEPGLDSDQEDDEDGADSVRGSVMQADSGPAREALDLGNTETRSSFIFSNVLGFSRKR